MSIRNLFSALLGANLEPPEAEVPTDATVSAVTSTAQRMPSAPQTPRRTDYNYNNNPASAAVMDTVKSYPTPPGGTANPGVWGLLPKRLQSGALRNIIGALGDSYLVGNGMKPTYGPRMERQQIGQALAGMSFDDPASVQEAIQRIAGTGAEGSIDFANQLQKDFMANETKQQIAEQTNETRQAQNEDTQRYRNEQTRIRELQTLDRFENQFDAMRTSATTPEEYKMVFDRATAIARRINPEFTAMDAGFISPEDWTPATRTAGLTANQFQQSQDRGAGREVSTQNNIRSNATRRATDNPPARPPQPTIASMTQDLIRRRRDGETLTIDEENFLKRNTVPPGRSGRQPVAPGRGGPQPKAAPQVVKNKDVTFLKNNDTPQNRARFEKNFGPGSAKKYLGY